MMKFLIFAALLKYSSAFFVIPKSRIPLSTKIGLIPKRFVRDSVDSQNTLPVLYNPNEREVTGRMSRVNGKFITYSILGHAVAVTFAVGLGVVSPFGHMADLKLAYDNIGMNSIIGLSLGIGGLVADRVPSLKSVARDTRVFVGSVLGTKTNFISAFIAALALSLSAAIGEIFLDFQLK